MIPALLLLEGGAYSAEIGERGRFVGAILVFLTYLIAALAAFVVVFLALPHKAPPKPNRSYVRIANTCSVLLLIFYAIPVLVYGPTILNGQTRYAFLDNPYVKYFNVKLYLAMICAYHGWMLRLTGRFAYLCIFVAILVLMVCWGEKASGPQYAITYFVAGLLLAGGGVRKILKPMFFLAPLAVAIWALPTLLAGRSNEITDAFLDRLARQAQIFYKVVDDPPTGAGARISLEALDYFGEYTPHQNGMNYLKDQYITDSLRDIHRGSLAAGYPAILISAWGLTGFILIFFLEIIRFLLMREVLIVGFQAQLIILAPVYLYLLNYIGKIYESGNAYLVTSPVFLTMIAVVFVSNRIRLNYTRKPSSQDPVKSEAGCR